MSILGWARCKATPPTERFFGSRVGTASCGDGHSCPTAERSSAALSGGASLVSSKLTFHHETISGKFGADDDHHPNASSRACKRNYEAFPRGLPGTIFGVGELHSRRINHFHAENLAGSETAVSQPQLAISQTTWSKNQPNQPRENSHGNRHGFLSLILPALP